jgi:hypothetical protein
VGGDFWYGLIQGGAIAGFNHGLHRVIENIEDGLENDKKQIPSGEINFIKLTKEQLKQFQVIPEDGDPYTPTENGTYSGDGVYFKNFSDLKYWYKVSAGSSVTITFSNNLFYFSRVTSSFWKWAAEKRNKYYYVGWEPKSRPHNTKNPFDLNRK